MIVNLTQITYYILYVYIYIHVCYLAIHTLNLRKVNIIQTPCYPLHLIGSLQNALRYQYPQLKNNYRNLKPTKIHYRNQIPLNCTTYFYHVPCAPALFQSEDLNTPTSDFHHVPAAVHSSQSGPSC